MTPDVGSVRRRSSDDREVVAAIDEADGRTQFVIADLTRDGAWVAAAETTAASLEEWR